MEIMKFKAIYVKLMVKVGKGNEGKNKSWNKKYRLFEMNST